MFSSNNAPKIRIFAGQASYGDTLGLELDPSPPTKTSKVTQAIIKQRLQSQTRMFFLIDGGPAREKKTGTIANSQLPISDFYKMLTDLAPVGSTGINTLVVTHDDLDHILGIAVLLRQLTTQSDPSLWPQGMWAVNNGQSPFLHIWHNSAETMVNNFNLKTEREIYTAKLREAAQLAEAEKKIPGKRGGGMRGDLNHDKQKEDNRDSAKSGDSSGGRRGRDKSQGKQKRQDESKDKLGETKKTDKKADQDAAGDDNTSPVKKPPKKIPNLNKETGYFDKALESMKGMGLKASKGQAPAFNDEWSPAQNEAKRYHGLLGFGRHVTRGDTFMFKFLGPGEAEIACLAKYFTENVSTTATIRKLTDKEIHAEHPPLQVTNKAEELGDNLLRAVKDDPSLKNVSSIVFEVQDLGSKNRPLALFTGDASACRIFRDKWKGKPIFYDLIKIGHHGSCYNNFFSNEMIETVRNKVKNKELEADVPWLPSVGSWEGVFTGDADPDSKEVISLGNVLAYFCNVRARNYLISASHDKHPNPHISTLIGIITASILYPADGLDKGPVRIYLTNPIHKNAWVELLSFWFRVLDMTESEPSTDKTEPTTMTSKYNHLMAQLLKYADREHELWDSLEGKALLSLRPDANGADRRFQIYCLKPKSSYGAIRINSYQWIDNEEQAVIHAESQDWEHMTPHDPASEAFLQHNYTKDFSMLGSGGTKWTDDKTTRLHFGKDGKAVFKLINTNNKAPPSTPVQQRLPHGSPLISHYDPDTWNNQGQFGRVINFMSSSKMNFTIQQNTTPFRKVSDNPKTFSAMKLEDITPPPMMDESSRPLGAPISNLEQTSAQTSATTTGATPATSSSHSEKYNYNVFRKFNIDAFDIPSVNDFVTKGHMKIKHLDSFPQLLAYLVENNKLSKEHAINAGTRHAHNGHPTLGALTYLMLGTEGAGTVLRTLPFDLSASLQFLNDRTLNPLHWPVQLVDVAVVDTSVLEKLLDKKSGVQKFSMRIFPQIQPENLVWVVPNEAKLLGKGSFEIQINSCVDVTIYWPTEPKRRIVHGRFLGSLPTGKQKRHNVVCEWLLMPGESSPVVYHVDFADENHNTADHEMNILEMMAAFDGASVGLGLALADAVFPGLINAEKPLGDHIKLSEPGFTICRSFQNARNLRLDGVFGKFSVSDVESWKPFHEYASNSGLEGFLGRIEIPMPSIQLCAQDFFSTTGTRIFFRINHSIRIGNSDLAYEIETRPGPQTGRLFEFTFRPVNAGTQTPLTVKQLLETFGLDALSGNDVPQFVIDAISSISLTFFRLGWSGELGIRLPDYLELGIRVENLSVTDSLLEVEDVMVRLRIDNPSKKETRNFYLQSWGTFSLVNVEHIARLTYGEHPAIAWPNESKSLIDPVTLSVQCVDTPLTLGHILRHFWPDTEIVPAPFNKVTNEVGLREFLFETGYSSEKKKQVVELIKISVGVTQSRITILNGLSLIEPTLDITAYSPFDKELRAFMVTFSAMLTIDGHMLLVKLGVATGNQAAFAVGLRAGGEPFPVGAFLRFVSRQIGKAFDISYPENFGILDRTEINDFSLFVAKGKDDKYSIQDFSFQAQSKLDLELWKSASVKLERIILNTGYKSVGGFDVAFGAELCINEHLLLASAKYGDPQNIGLSLSDEFGRADEKGWFIQVEYPDEIDLSAIAKKLMGIELGDKVSAVDIGNDKMKPDKDKGIVISDLVMTLQKAKSGGGIYISAETNWAVFEYIELAATYYGSSEWGFCLSMDLKDDLLSLIPAQFTQKFSEWIKVNNTTVAIYVGKIDPKKAGLDNPKLPPAPGSKANTPSGSIQAGLSVSTTIQLTEKFGLVKKWIGKGELELEGHISTKSVGMNATIPTQLAFGDKDAKTGEYPIEIKGGFYFDINLEKGFELGLSAAMKIRSPAVTKDLIDIQRVSLLVNEASGVGFDTRVDGPLRDLFGLEGLEARGLLMRGVFSIAQSGMPEQLSLKGALSLAGTGASGHINLYFAQRDLLNCYFDGQLQNIDIAGLINFGLKKKGLPQVAEEFLGGNVVMNNLQLEAALSDIDIPKPKKKLKSGFFYEASLYIKAGSYRWSGYTCIEVHDNALQVISMMSPVSFSAESQNFFRLTRGSIVPRDHSIPRPNGDQYEEKMFKDGPIIYISNRNPDTWLLISLHLTLLSLDFELTAQGDRSGFELEIPKANVGVDLSQIGQPGNLWVSLEGSAKVKPNEMANAELKINAALNLELPDVILSGLQQQLKLPGKVASVVFNLVFEFSIGWPQTGRGFNVTFTGNANALGQPINLFTMAVNLSPQELDSIQKVVTQAVLQFVNVFPEQLIRDLLGKDLNGVADFLKEKFGDDLGKNLLTAISMLSKMKPEEVVKHLGREFLGFVGDGAKKALLEALGVYYGARDAMIVMGQKFNDLLRWIPFLSINSTLRVSGGAALKGLEKGPGLAPSLEEVRIYRLDENGNELEENITPFSVSAPTKMRVTMVEEEPGRGVEGENGVAPAGVWEVGVKQGDETVIQEWTQQQVDEYVRLQRLSLLEVSLEVFPVEEVFDAARGLFEDLSDEQVLEYMVEANTNDENVHSIQSLG